MSFVDFSKYSMVCTRLALAFLLLTSAMAVSAIYSPVQAGVAPTGNPIMPEAEYADDLSQTITLQPRIHVNHASLNQLRLLPGFDSDLALKVMRSRPFVNMNDFYQKMPVPCKKRLGFMRARLQLVVSFD
jgi:hypothetical protein